MSNCRAVLSEVENLIEVRNICHVLRYNGRRQDNLYQVQSGFCPLSNENNKKGSTKTTTDDLKGQSVLKLMLHTRKS
jgi:hypothetical protein